MAKNNGYADSIMQDDLTRCFLCGERAEWNDKLDRHEAFGGAFREKSKRLGLWCMLHHTQCHQYGPQAVHQNAESMLFVKQAAQRAAMEAYGWDTEDFIREFGRNYL